jgi:TPR repeat protein
MTAKLKFIALALAAAVALGASVPAEKASAADAAYDPIHTMSALNMAIVSINRVASSEDRVTLNAEYENIIDNLYLGNIEDDPELKALYLELIDAIGKKALRQDEAARVREEYDSREKKRLSGLIARFAAAPAAPWSLVGDILAGELSGYFGITALAAEKTGGLPDELRKLERENVEDLMRIQERLLDTSWTLVRRYGLPDEYRLAQRDLGDFDKAVREPDREKSLRMLNALERNFAMYAPFWYYRAAAAAEIRDGAAAEKYLAGFDRAWRPVLRRDPYKAAVAKMRARALSDSKASNAEIAAQIDILAENTQRENWVDNLFAGVMYYATGDAAKARERISINVDFGAERDISALALRDIENGTLDAGVFLDEVQALQASRERGYYESYNGQALAERGLVAWFRGDSNIAASLMAQALDANASADDPLPLQIFFRLSASALSFQGTAVDETLRSEVTLRNAANLRKEAERRLASSPPLSWEALLPIAERYAGVSANAKTFLADLYMTGRGVPADPIKAAELFKDPADAGDAYAAAQLGEILETVDGLRDLGAAARYYGDAARQGLPWAAMKLGDMYSDGRARDPDGKNLENAYMWYALAQMDGEPSAKSKLDEMEGKGLLKLKSVNAATVARATARALEIHDARER